MIKKVSEFKVIDESGKAYTVNVFQNFINVSDLQNHAVKPGMKTFELSDGTNLNPANSENTGFTTDTGKRFAKI